MPSFDAYLSDYLVVVAGVLGGNVVLVSLPALGVLAVPYADYRARPAE